jgi:hypothetical protein
MDVIKTITNPRYNYYEGKTTGVRVFFNTDIEKNGLRLDNIDQTM